jgi:hypothetical protein
MFMFALDRLTETRPAKRASAFVAIALAAFTLPTTAANIAPTNLPATFCDDVIAGDQVIASSIQINTDTQCDEVVGQVGATALCVLRANNFTVTAAGSLSFGGSRPAVISAQGDMTILGAIFAASGNDPSFSGANGLAQAGGGGAGGGTNGGTGGSSSSGASGGSGGGARGNKALHPLIGGAHGGLGGGNTTTPGGSGGGALQIVACHTLTLNANVLAGGFGGLGGQAESNFNNADGGGGGGSGGGLLLEGDAVTVTADLIANGGGGGGGGTTGLSSGSSGAPGGNGFSLTAATGGLPGSSSAGMGSSGGASSGAPGFGSNASTTFGAGGGGGGAAGRIRINFCNSVSSNPSLISPAATIGISCSDVIFRDGFEPAS